MSLMRPPMHDSGNGEPVMRRNAIAERPYEYPYADVLPVRPQGPWDGGYLMQYWRILRRRKIALLSIAAVTALAAYFVTRAQTPQYRAHTLLEVQSLNEDFLNLKSVTPTNATTPYTSPEYHIRTQTLVLQSRPVLERALAQKDLENRLLAASEASSFKPWKDSSPPSSAHEKALLIASESMGVRAEPDTRIVQLSFEASDPALSADLTNAVAQSFIELNGERRWQASQATTEWLSKQVDDIQRRLSASEGALNAFTTRSGLTILADRENAAEAGLLSIQGELSKAQADRIAKQSVLELAKSASPETLGEILDDPALKDGQVQVTTLQRQQAEFASTFTPAHPKMAAIQTQLQTVEKALEARRQNIMERIRNDYTAAERRERLLKGDYDRQAGIVSQQSTQLTRYADLKRDYDANRELYDLMVQRVHEASMATAMQAAEIRVVEAAAPPIAPFSPNIILNTAAGLLGGFLLGGVVLIQRTRANRGIMEPGEVAVELQVPELGVIPASGSEWARVRKLLGKSNTETLSRNGEARPELVTWQRWPSAMGESFRLLLTSILLAGKSNGNRPRIIAFTSANPGEGKTTVVSNLAVALAKVGRRVLVIDGDVRKPRLHDIFDVDNSTGLSDFVSSDTPMSVRETQIPNLFIIPAGRSADEKLFFNSRLRRMLRRLKPEFDMILVDTPPVLHISDARLLGRQADAVVLVVAQHTNRDAVHRAQQRLTEDGAHLLGTVLNNWNPKDSLYSEKDDYNVYSAYTQRAAAS